MTSLASTHRTTWTLTISFAQSTVFYILEQALLTPSQAKLYYSIISTLPPMFPPTPWLIKATAQPYGFAHVVLLHAPQAPRHSFLHSVPSMIIVHKPILPNTPHHQHQTYCHQTPTTALFTLSLSIFSLFIHLPTLTTTGNMASISSSLHIIINPLTSKPHGITSFAPEIFQHSLIPKLPSSKPLSLLLLPVTPLIAPLPSGGYYFTSICSSCNVYKGTMQQYFNWAHLLRLHKGNVSCPAFEFIYMLF